MKRRRWSDDHDIVVEKDGKQYGGHYRTDNCKSPGIKVYYGGVSRYAFLHAHPPELLARLLLLELVREQEYAASQ